MKIAKTLKPAPTTTASQYEFPADFEMARFHFAHYLRYVLGIAEHHGLRVLLRSEEEIFGLQLAERAGVTAFTGRDGKATLAVVDVRRRDRRPVFYLNAEEVYEGSDPDRLLIEVLIAVKGACEAVEVAKAA